MNVRLLRYKIHSRIAVHEQLRLKIFKLNLLCQPILVIKQTISKPLTSNLWEVGNLNQS